MCPSHKKEEFSDLVTIQSNAPESEKEIQKILQSIGLPGLRFRQLHHHPPLLSPSLPQPLSQVPQLPLFLHPGHPLLSPHLSLHPGRKVKDGDLINLVISEIIPVKRFKLQEFTNFFLARFFAFDSWQKDYVSYCKTRRIQLLQQHSCI